MQLFVLLCFVKNIKIYLLRVVGHKLHLIIRVHLKSTLNDEAFDNLIMHYSMNLICNIPCSTHCSSVFKVALNSSKKWSGFLGRLSRGWLCSIILGLCSIISLWLIFWNYLIKRQFASLTSCFTSIKFSVWTCSLHNILGWLG